MISVYHDTDGWLQLSGDWAKGSWIHVESPDEGELELLHEHLGVPMGYLHAALDPREVARTDSRNGTQLVIVRAPHRFDGEGRVPYRTIPVAMLTTADYFITICRRPIDFVRELNYSYDEREVITRNAGHMILAILRVVAERYLEDLQEVDEILEGIEDRLADSIENSEMLELLRYEKSLVYLKTGLDWNKRMVAHLEEREGYHWDEADHELLADVQIEYSQGLQVAETTLALLEAMTDALASLISNNLNIVMKFLTAVTIILTIPAVIGAIYGMNVILPGDDHKLMWLVLLALMAIICLIVGWWFYKQDWLSFRWRRHQSRGEKEG